MKVILKYAKRFTLGFLVLLLFSNSTFAYSVDFHFCQDEFVAASFFGKKATCSKMDGLNLGSCCDKYKTPSDDESVSSKSCCSNEQLDNSSVLDKKINAAPAFYASQLAILPPVISIISNATFKLDFNTFNIAHPPFLYWTDHQSRLQVFLI